MNSNTDYIRSRTLGVLALAFLPLACSNSSTEDSSDGGVDTETASETEEETEAASDSEATDVSESDSTNETDPGTTDAVVTDVMDTDPGPIVDEGTDTSGDGGAEMNCGASPFGAEQVPANVLVVLDKSGSMTDVPDAFDEDKWTAVKAAMSNALESVEEDVSFGLSLFPSPEGCDVPTDGTISVDVGPGSDTVSTIIDLLDETEPSGGTPTAAALGQALEYFTDGAGGSLEGRKYVLLATDGGPACNEGLSCDADQCVVNLEGRCPEGFTNCCDPEEGGPGAERNCLDGDETLVQVEALQAAGIDTFVVGIPGSESFSDSLDAFAVAGGQSLSDTDNQYFAVGDTDALSEVLSSITRDLFSSCELQLESEPPDLEKLNVEVEGELIAQDGDDGWDLNTATEPPTVILKGATCEHIESEGVETIRVVYGCPTFRVR